VTGKQVTGLRAAWVAVLLILPVITAGCAASGLYKQGTRSAAAGDWDAAVLAFAKASATNPESGRYKISLIKAKQKASIVHFDKARKYLATGQLDLAIGELQATTVLDQTNEYAQVELEKALIEWQKRRSERKKTEMELMKERARQDQGVPRLNPASNIPIILKFKEEERGQIYEALSKASGINFLYDTRLDLKKEVSLDLTNVTFEDAMNTLMLMNKHFFKVIDENTILIAEDTQQKRREIEDEVIKTFYLSNAEVKDVQTLLRTLLDARKIVQNTQLNAITIRDTPNRVAIAEKIVAANDKSKAELLIDVELLEVSRTVSKTLGINLSSQRYSVGFTGGDALPLNNLGLLRQLGNYAIGPIPSVTLDFLKSDSGTRTIAKPQLRVTEGEKANLHIGDSVPIPTTSFNAGFGGGAGGGVGQAVPITSFTYQEVGIVIEIEPRVHHNNEVSLNLNVEVSQLGEQVSTGQGQSAPAINTRQIGTVIRLRDGETNLLAGLIRDDGSEGRSGFPGLVDVPFLRRIFSSQTETHRETDLILTLTPHIIRIPDIRDEDMAPLFIGTRNNPHLRGSATSPFGPDPFGPKIDEISTESAAGGADGAVPGENSNNSSGEANGGENSGPSAAGANSASSPGEAPAENGPVTLSMETLKDMRAQERAEAAVEAAEFGQDVDEPESVAVAAETTGKPKPLSRSPTKVNPRTGRRMIMEEEVAKPKTPTEPPRSLDPAPSPLAISLAPARLTVAGGGGFAFNIMVTKAADLRQVNLIIKYDPAVAEFDRGLEGVLMRADGAGTTFSARKTSAGTLVVELKRVSPGRGATGSGSIAAIRFRPIGAGRTLVNISDAKAVDGKGRPIPVLPKGADVTISQ
jgi:general secretion pathway protein D